MARIRELLTVGHSYVVALNRRLAYEMAVAGRGRWEVTVAAPKFVHGDLRPIPFEPESADAGRTLTYPLRFSGQPHLRFYSRRLRELVRSRWDLVHVWEEPYVAAGFQLCRWVRDETPLVFWTAQNINKRYPPPFRWWERYCVGKCCGWLACGQTTVETLDPRGYAAKPHCVVPLGIDLDVFRPDRKARDAILSRFGWSSAGPPVVGYLGRFISAKGLEMLCNALDATSSPWRALFVGGGTMEVRLREWQARRADDRIRIVTDVPHDEVPAYLNAMDILAAPSQTTPRWREQLGRMLIEAMACGVTVVGSDSGEIPYVIDDAGIVLPESDQHAWTETLGDLLDSPERRESYRRRGLECARSRFAWSVVARRHLEFFDGLLDRNASKS